MKRVLGLAVVALASVQVASPALARSTDVRASGSCSRASTWSIKLRPEARTIQVEFEVDSNVVGQTWNVVIRDNGSTVFSGSATTVAPSGSFELKRSIADQRGQDVITAVATNTTPSETCSGRAAL